MRPNYRFWEQTRNQNVSKNFTELVTKAGLSIKGWKIIGEPCVNKTCALMCAVSSSWIKGDIFAKYSAGRNMTVKPLDRAVDILLQVV